ncbi:helix-turn-helix transcriptional regulator [Bacteroides fragilis]|nr:helix-turn-helix transcriptional regulator [Bacteroides fragilis]
MVKNNGSIGSDIIENILRIYPDVNADWLLTGRGPMLCASTIENIPNINQEYKGAPYYNVDFIGGFDFVPNDQTMNPDYYINYPPYNKDGVLWCNLTGHSMEPEISNGDIIAVREANTQIEYLPAGEIYGIITDDYRTIKRIRPGDNKGFVRLIPSNKSPEFCEQEIPINMIRRVYIVLGSIRKFF